MPGGQMNLVSIGTADQILIGEPKKSFWNYSYHQYSQFGKQHFRVDFDGQRDLRLTEPSKFSFTMPRYADLISDIVVSVTLPNIWSPIYQPCVQTGNQWASYDFRWIRDLGAQMLQEVEITCGNFTIAKYSGQYLTNMVKRDFQTDMRQKFDTMTGNVAELNHPSAAFGRINVYPNAFYTENQAGAEPSIRSRTLYIPINSWFTLDNRCAFPLLALQYNSLVINITIRPIQELFQCRDVFDAANFYPYVQPDFNQSQFQMYRFLQTPPSTNLDMANYANQNTSWNADVHLETVYVFLSETERKKMAMEEHAYLVKDVYEYNFQNITGTQRVELKTNGLVTGWMWNFQRNDVNLRNEWSNYSNWPYHALPSNLQPPPYTISIPYNNNTDASGNYTSVFGPIMNPSGNNTGYYISGDFSPDNQKNILLTMAVLLDGEYRELDLPSGVFQFMEKYKSNMGSPVEYEDGLYCYNFCLNSDPFNRQPSGAMNLTRFKRVQLGFTTYVPPINPDLADFEIICSTEGVPIGVKKASWKLYNYNYNLNVYEERYNVITFIGGYCGALFAR
jgi:hypothetical protein